MKEIIINRCELGTKLIALLENGILIEKYEETDFKKRSEGNIYLGKVKNVLPGMQAAFIDIGESRAAFMPIRDLLDRIHSQENNNDKNIRKYIKPGINVLVQIKRDSTEKKGARISKHFSITSRYIVLMPDNEYITISNKIENKEEAERLIDIVKNALPKKCGAIIRTSAINKGKEQIEKDINLVYDKWIKILKKKEITNTAPTLIYKSHSITKRILLDLMDKDIERIIVNNDEDYEEIDKFLKEHDCEIKIIKDERDLKQMYNLNNQIEKAKNRKIWLKCGGFITIDKTEALTAIDVNSGKYIGKENLENTVFKVNQEATIEIAKQIRLRDIGGIIIIDYIDMFDEENKQKIINILKENLKDDRTKTQIEGFTKLNLLEMSRKHVCSNLDE